MDYRVRMYVTGMAAAFVLFAAGELIWLPDPVRFPGGLYWIDILDGLIYLAAAVPLLWAAAAVDGLIRSLRGTRGTTAGPWPAIRSLLVIVPAGAAAAFLLIFRIDPARLIITAGLFGSAWLMVFVDMAFIRRRNGKSAWASIIMPGAALALLAGLFWPQPYLVTYPGVTVNMNRYAQAEGGTAHGSIAGVLIFERPAFPVDWLYARLFPHYSFDPIEQLGMPLGEYDEQVRTMKQDANAAGSAIAYQQLGLGKGIVPQGIRITGIQKNSPAGGVLHAGDIIIAVNRKPVLSIKELAALMEGVKPGQSVAVTVKRGGADRTITADTGRHPEDAKRAAFGITVENEGKPDIPGSVRFHRYLVHEGGPSHGAMLALALIDQLTPGGVTYGHKVAGTGTIGEDGAIGPVGGVEQKAYTVYRAGADVFFVPAGLEDEAKRGAPKLNIVPVHTLTEVLKWLKDRPV